MDKVNETKIREMYALRRPVKWISKETGMSTDKIKKYLQGNNLWTGHRSMLSYYDEFFFDKIDTEEKAYWLGFIYADGYLAYPNNVGIEIKSTDKEHLERFRKDLKAEKEVKVYHKNSTFGPQDNARFSVCSAHMFKILLSYFKSVHKTFEGEFPKLRDDKLTRHLIRGFFDGDGSLTGVPKTEDHVWRPQIGFIGTKETLQYIEEISGFKWSWTKRHPEKPTNNYQISCGRVNDCLSFLHWLYDDATVYLDRKHERYIEMLKNRKRNQAKARV